MSPDIGRSIPEESAIVPTNGSRDHLPPHAVIRHLIQYIADRGIPLGRTVGTALKNGGVAFIVNGQAQEVQPEHHGTLFLPRRKPAANERDGHGGQSVEVKHVAKLYGTAFFQVHGDILVVPAAVDHALEEEARREVEVPNIFSNVAQKAPEGRQNLSERNRNMYYI